MTDLGHEQFGFFMTWHQNHCFDHSRLQSPSLLRMTDGDKEIDGDKACRRQSRDKREGLCGRESVLAICCQISGMRNLTFSLRNVTINALWCVFHISFTPHVSSSPASFTAAVGILINVHGHAFYGMRQLVKAGWGPHLTLAFTHSDRVCCCHPCCVTYYYKGLSLPPLSAPTCRARCCNPQFMLESTQQPLVPFTAKYFVLFVYYSCY